MFPYHAISPYGTVTLASGTVRVVYRIETVDKQKLEHLCTRDNQSTPMEKTFLYTKRFIDKQVKTLNEPLQLSDSLKEILAKHEDAESSENKGISEQQLQKVLLRVNQQIKRHNRNVFAVPVITQMTEQLVEIERSKLAMVKEKIARTGLIMRPMLISGMENISGEQIKKLGDIVEDLPESGHLLFTEDDDGSTESSNESGSYDSDGSNNQILVQDVQNKVEKEPSQKKRRTDFKRQLAAFAKSRIEDESTKSVLESYDRLRLEMKELHHQLQYKYEKNLYLTELDTRIRQQLGVSPPKGEGDIGSDYDTDEHPDFLSDEESKSNDILANKSTSSNLSNEVHKLQVLLQKITYKINTSRENILDALHEINRK